jgi:hypothetical protein
MKEWFRKNTRNHWSPAPRNKTRIDKVPWILSGYCQLWIDSYALKTKSLYLKLNQEGPDPLLWIPEEVKTSPYHSPNASFALS